MSEFRWIDVEVIPPSKDSLGCCPENAQRSKKAERNRPKPSSNQVMTPAAIDWLTLWLFIGFTISVILFVAGGAWLMWWAVRLEGGGLY